MSWLPLVLCMFSLTAIANFQPNPNLIPVGAISGVWTDDWYKLEGIYEIPAHDTLVIMSGARVLFGTWCHLTVHGVLIAGTDQSRSVDFIGDTSACRRPSVEINFDHPTGASRLQICQFGMMYEGEAPEDIVLPNRREFMERYLAGGVLHCNHAEISLLDCSASLCDGLIEADSNSSIRIYRFNGRQLNGFASSQNAVVNMSNGSWLKLELGTFLNNSASSILSFERVDSFFVATSRFSYNDVYESVIHFDSSKGQVIDCRFDSNTGGAILSSNRGSEVLITQSTLFDNDCSDKPGELFVRPGGYISADHCTFVGAQVNAPEETITFDFASFEEAGGIVANYGRFICTNSLFAYSWPTNVYVTGKYPRFAPSSVIWCGTESGTTTFWSDTLNGAIAGDTSDGTLADCSFFNVGDSISVSNARLGVSDPNSPLCVIPVHIINCKVEDPQFVNPVAGLLRLQPTSPCVNKGGYPVFKRVR